jgi:hypothetical protein
VLEEEIRVDMRAQAVSERGEIEGRGGELGCTLGGPHELAGLRVVKRRPAACRLGERAGGKEPAGLRWGRWSGPLWLLGRGLLGRGGGGEKEANSLLQLGLKEKEKRERKLGWAKRERERGREEGLVLNFYVFENFTH